MLNREICKGCGYYHELTGGPFVLPIWGCASFLLALIEDLSAKDGSRKKVKESGSTHILIRIAPVFSLFRYTLQAYLFTEHIVDSPSDVQEQTGKSPEEKIHPI